MNELPQRVFDVLSNWKGLDSLKTLFWKELNYEWVNEQFPKSTWTEKVLSLVADDPLVFAKTGIDGEFRIFYFRLSDKLQLTAERQLVEPLITKSCPGLFVFSDKEQVYWHLVNVREGAKKDDTRVARRIFRRITLGPNEKVRTASERLYLLDVDSAKLSSASMLEIQSKHDEAFDVQAVTDKFYGEYRKIFREIQQRLYNQQPDKKWAHDYALQFLNRLMFLYFIQRKKWLGNNPEFMIYFWDTYKRSGEPKDTFFEKWLSVMFFEAFNERFQAGRSDHNHFPNEIKTALANAPFLNGGLFRENKLDTDYQFNIPDEIFVTLFDRYEYQNVGFFEHYNFTISEDTPFDQEVAVDPEMIGKVYESLVNITFEKVEEQDRRGMAGIFYTPRIEIDLMCRLSLVDWLSNHLGQARKELLYQTILAYSPQEKKEADEAVSQENLWVDLNKLLQEVTVLDPACGSGSFLVGMLFVLDDLQERAAKQLGKSETPYERRKRIIGQSLYGVDVMPWAVHVAELRLWLQLMVETPVEPAELKFRPLLPNLTFKIRPGDSLVQEIGGINFGLHQRHLEISRGLKGRLTQLKGKKLNFYQAEDTSLSEESILREERDLFRDILKDKQHTMTEEIKILTRMIESPPEQIPLVGIGKDKTKQPKLELYQEDREQKQSESGQINAALNAIRESNSIPFVWDIAFVEIFEGDKGAFDIVIGNPPYVRQEKIADPNLDPEEYGGEESNQWKTKKQDYKEKLQKSVAVAYPKFFGYKPGGAQARKLAGRSDYYIYFYLHGLSLLNPKGSFCFITSNSWLDVDFGKDLQEFLLKHSHVKLIIDNQVKRSFAQADVNTIIALLAPSDDNNQLGLQKTARFVMFKTPFESVLHPVIFWEIEDAKEIIRKPEYRCMPKLQSELLAEGLKEPEDELEGHASACPQDAWKCVPPNGRVETRPSITSFSKYEGNKWGGKYLRAPDIYWTILEKGKGKLVRLGDIAEVRFGIKTGANEFFYLDDAKIREWGIESEFLKPVIKSPRECKRILIDPKDLKYKIFMCHKSKDELKGTTALEYIKWGESQGFHKRPSCRGRARWWEIIGSHSGLLAWAMIHAARHNVHINPTEVELDHNFFEILHSERDAQEILAAFAISCLGVLMKELYGRQYGGGSGPIKTDGVDIVQMHFLLPNSIHWGTEAQEIFRKTIECSPISFEEGCDRKTSIPIDHVIFDALGLTQSERDAVYEAVIQLVEARLAKADSLR